HRQRLGPHAAPTVGFHPPAGAGRARAPAPRGAYAHVPRPPPPGLALPSVVAAVLLTLATLTTTYWLYAPDPAGGDDCSGLARLITSCRTLPWLP
ncbi:hypothetical protein ACFXAN_27320, partial [Streptomyces misionensis]